MKRSLLATFSVLGPGFAVAATGIGAGDVVAAAVSGAQFGTVVLWAAVVGAVLKFVLNVAFRLSVHQRTGDALLMGMAGYIPCTGTACRAPTALELTTRSQEDLR